MLLALTPSVALADGWLAKWPYRRAIDVTWPADKAIGSELALVEFHSACRHRASGDDIRLTDSQARPVGFRLLEVGPGDRIRAVFRLKAGESRYYAYFGREDEAPVEPAYRDIAFRAGLLWEVRPLKQDTLDAAELEKAFEASGPNLTARMIARPFVGLNPLGEGPPRTLSRFTGAIFAPQDGDYTFALAADDRAVLLVNGRTVATARHLTGDARFTGAVKLSRGRHDVTIYLIDLGNDLRLSLAWRRPGSPRIEPVGPDAFGLLYAGQVGPLQRVGTGLVADIMVEYLGESFYNNHYSHRYRLTASSAPNASYQWTLGDGQSRGDASLEHVYLADGVYEIGLTARLGAASDAQKIRLPVARQTDRTERPPWDEPPVHSRIVAGYIPAKMTTDSLPWAVRLHLRAQKADEAGVLARELASRRRWADPRLAVEALEEATLALLRQGKSTPAMAVWEAADGDTVLRGRIARSHAEQRLWWLGDAAGAAAVATAGANEPRELQIARGQALVLSGKAIEGAKILRAIEPRGDPKRQAALAGALARTVEYHILDKDWESADTAWDRWQDSYPDDFLDGYSMSLKVQIIALRGQGGAAAKLAEAFAAAVPRSSYSPRLLHEAAKLLEKSDPAKSGALIKLLKERYPEDPLAQ